MASSTTQSRHGPFPSLLKSPCVPPVVPQPLLVILSFSVVWSCPRYHTLTHSIACWGWPLRTVLLSSGCFVATLKVSGRPPAEGHRGCFSSSSSEYVVCKCRATMNANFHMNMVLVFQEYISCQQLLSPALFFSLFKWHVVISYTGYF